MGHEYAFRSGQPTAKAEATLTARYPLDKEEADALGWLVSLLTESNASEGMAGQGGDATATGTARASASI